MINRYKSKTTKRKVRVRSKIKRISTRPRLTVHRTLKQIYAQIIDDKKQITLVAASSLNLKTKPGTSKTKIAELVGANLAKKAKLKKITKIVFDRGSYQYHGRVKALAETVRKAGLKF